MMRALFVGLALLGIALSARGGERIEVLNATRPTHCAEEDNVYVKLIADGIRRFRVEARHPAYLANLREDNSAPDFSSCDMSGDPSFPFEAKDVVLYDDAEWRLMGHTFGSFWRPERVDFRVGDETFPTLHLVQLIRKIEGQSIEVLVVYPADGYWRAKPLPPKGRIDTAYGSSFLVGPVVEGRRPYVPIREIAFDRATLTFRLSFRTGEGTLRVAEASREVTRLEVRLPPAPGGKMFAALRSMFVSPAAADMSEVAVDGGPPRPILDFRTADAAAVWFLRSTPSHHNTSAPDLGFFEFAR